MIRKEHAEAAMKNYVNNISKSARWELGNKILYDICSAYPKHNNSDEVVAKMWLIGKSYSAAVERRKNAAGFKGDFYYDCVAPTLLTIGSKLDSMICGLKNHSFDEESLPQVIATHTLLQDALENITEMKKRSLTSKYLHFHCPNAFPILDSFAYTTLKKIVTSKGNLKYSGNGDTEYIDYCTRFLELKKYYEHQYSRAFSLREMDSLLLNYQVPEAE